MSVGGGYTSLATCSLQASRASFACAGSRIGPTSFGRDVNKGGSYFVWRTVASALGKNGVRVATSQVMIGRWAMEHRRRQQTVVEVFCRPTGRKAYTRILPKHNVGKRSPLWRGLPQLAPTQIWTHRARRSRPSRPFQGPQLARSQLSKVHRSCTSLIDSKS